MNPLVEKTKKCVNIRLYSILKIFYLPERVWLSFSKLSFFLSSSLYEYFNKTLLQSLENFFNICLYRLLDLDIIHLSIADQFSILGKFNLSPLRVRLFFRVNFLIYKVMNRQTLCFLYDSLIFTQMSILRRPNLVSVPLVKTRFQILSFRLFLPTLVNKSLRNSYNLTLKDFGSYLKQHLFLLFNEFEK